MLRAGYRKVEITPDSSLDLIGYDFRDCSLEAGNGGVHDPLFARVLAVEEEGQKAVLVSLDLAIISAALAGRMKTAIAGKAGTLPERVIVACTHTHSGPVLEDPFHEEGTGEKARPDEGRGRYVEALIREVAQAAAQAAGLMVPVEALVAEAPLGLAYDRRVPTAEGLRHCWNPHESIHLPLRPAADPTCTVLELRQVRGPRRFVIWSVGAHGVVLGKTSRQVSADWPGLACRLIEEYEPGVRALFLQGACGHAHPWIATQEDPAFLLPVARAAASFVSLLTHALRPAGKEGSGRLLAMASARKTIGRFNLDLAVWGFGRCLLAAVPVELFEELSRSLRQRLETPLLMATNANGSFGYWPDRGAFSQVRYETQIALDHGLSPGDGEALIEELYALTAQLS